MAHDIIVVAASAGGVEALRTLVAGLPAGLPASLFMVLHIPAILPSALPTILSRSGPLPARRATEGMKIEQGTIYVAPPDHHLLLKQGYVYLGTAPRNSASDQQRMYCSVPLPVHLDLASWESS